MVAYSFAPQFVEAVSTLKKRQTVRTERKRHARPGEPLQLYAAMRTKHCRKLVTPDPVCLDVRHIVIELGGARHIQNIEINGVALSDADAEAFAVADGFGGSLADGFALRRMGEFWLRNHAWSHFVGVVVRWEPPAALSDQHIEIPQDASIATSGRTNGDVSMPLIAAVEAGCDPERGAHV